MTAFQGLALFLAIGLSLYLFWALFDPERFS
jgi:K+-transporting ATPase KdpF subunit